MRKYLTLIVLALLLIPPATPALAQTPTPPVGPVYIVQEDDTLWDIAVRFNVSVEELMAANGLTSADIFIGDRLVIPGLEGLNGILTTETIAFGETLRSLSRRYGVSEPLLRELNHIVSPTELYAGFSLVLLQQEGQSAWPARTGLVQGETMLELAARQQTDPWTIAEINSLPGTWAGLPGDVLYLPSGTADIGPTGLPPAFITADVSPLPLVQGGTTQIRVETSLPVTLGGVLADHPLHFFQEDNSRWVALQGIHAMLDPGLYPLRLEATLPDGSQQSFEQTVLVISGYYPNDPVLVVEPSTIDPAVTEPENAQVLTVVTPATTERYWQGQFRLPVSEPFCIKSWFGNRRSYNNSGFIYFHTGVDYGICSISHPYDIYAPAAGVVVFADPLTVRGNATIIDHGWGVYSGMWHQEEIYVRAGDHVEAGQLIGKIGKTGRATGPHLHWELWVNGIQVNPLDWLEEVFPH